MRLRVHLAAACAALVLLGAALPASAEWNPIQTYFEEWGISAYYGHDLDIRNGSLESGGIQIQLARSWLRSDNLRLDFHLDILWGYFWGHGKGAEVGAIPGLRLYLGKWSFTPYVEAGIGPSYNWMNIHELGTGFNFLSYGGAGVRIPLSGWGFMEIGYRLRHISNAGTAELNHGVTSHQGQIGVSFPF